MAATFADSFNEFFSACHGESGRRRAWQSTIGKWVRQIIVDGRVASRLAMTEVETRSCHDPAHVSPKDLICRLAMTSDPTKASARRVRRETIICNVLSGRICLQGSISDFAVLAGRQLVGLAIIAGKFVHAGIADPQGDFRHSEFRIVHQSAREAEPDLLETLHRGEADGLRAGASQGIGAAVKLIAEISQRDRAIDVLPRPGFHFPPKASIGCDGGVLADARIDGCE